MHGEGLESVEVGVEYQASYSCLFGTHSILFYYYFFKNLLDWSMWENMINL